MKVICIDASRGKVYGNIPEFKEGEILTAKQCEIYSIAYTILEYPNNLDGIPVSWLKERFIPLSEIDEMELIEKRCELIKIPLA